MAALSGALNKATIKYLYRGIIRQTIADLKSKYRDQWMLEIHQFLHSEWGRHVCATLELTSTLGALSSEAIANAFDTPGWVRAYRQSMHKQHRTYSGAWYGYLPDPIRRLPYRPVSFKMVSKQTLYR